MKKYLVLFTMILTMLLTACGGSGNNAGSSNGSDSGANAGTQTDSQQETVKVGYVFSYEGVDVIVDQKADEIIAALGEPRSYYEAASCAFDGLDKIYTYSSFQIYTYPIDDVDYISAVVLKDDMVATAEGVAIGDDLQKVKDTYGEWTEEQGMYVYTKDGMKLCFIAQDGIVVSIEYHTKVMDN